MRHTLPKTDTEMQHFVLAGRAYWRDVETGRVRRTVSGGDDPDPPTPPTPPAPAPDPERTFTQAELNSIAGQRAAESKRAAENAIVEQLGCTPAEAKVILDAARAEDDKLKTQAQRDAEAAATASAAAAADRAAAAQERQAAKAERLLTAAGLVLPEKAEDATATLARATRLLALDPDADDTVIGAEIDTLKAQMPGLFGTPADPARPTPPTPPGATGHRPPPPKTTGKSMEELGKETAERFRLPTRTPAA